jgi:hypothetical protein
VVAPHGEDLGGTEGGEGHSPGRRRAADRSRLEVGQGVAATEATSPARRPSPSPTGTGPTSGPDPLRLPSAGHSRGDCGSRRSRPGHDSRRRGSAPPTPPPRRA